MLNTKPISFRDLLSDLYSKRQTVCLKPTNADQQFLMLDGLLESLKAGLSMGGYIFASRSGASDAVRILSSLGIPYEVHSIEKIETMDIAEFSAISGIKKVFVFVEPEWTFDSAPVWNHFRAMFRAKLNQEVVSAHRTPFIFVNSAMKLLKGMSILFAQCRTFFSINIIDSMTHADVEVASALGEEPQYPLEARSLKANSVTVQGGGRGSIANALHVWLPELTRPASNIRLPEDNLVLVTGLFQEPFTVNLTEAA